MTDDRTTLPVPDYDHLALGALQHRIRSLDASGVQALLGYEEEHGNRAPVVQVLRARLDQLASGAEPSPGPADGETSDAPLGDPADTPGRVSGQQAPDPAINPPAHGVPTNPSQPRT